MSECRMCRNRGQTWSGSAPKCAFGSGAFSTDNWNCATMNALRSIAKAVGLNYRDDNCAASIGAVPYEGREEGGGYIVMTWYKDRGRTGMAQLMCDESEPESLTLEMAEDAIWFYTQGYGRKMLTDDWRWQDDRRGQSEVVAMLDELQAQSA